jgi:hypothetical protein
MGREVITTAAATETMAAAAAAEVTVTVLTMTKTAAPMRVCRTGKGLEQTTNQAAEAGRNRRYL